MKRQSRQVLGLLVCLSHCIGNQVLAQPQETGNSSPVADSESQFLFINLLEFLGEFETQAGDWVSPDILGNEVFSDLDGSGSDSPDTGSERSEQRTQRTPNAQTGQKVMSSGSEDSR